ncbi:MAG: nitroreductase [Chloroflexota bacterium]
MDALTAIYSRHSVGKVKSDPVPRSVVEKLLAAGAQAPNHYKVRPWRFIVLTGTGLDKFGDQLAAILQSKSPETSTEILNSEKNKAHRAPVIIAVGVDQPVEPRVTELENIAAAAAAIENMLIAAQAIGLNTIWRTGDAARNPEVKKFLGLSVEQNLLGFIYLGYPIESIPEFPERPTFEDRTVWLE